MADDLVGISVFVTAVEAGGFSAAAERLHLSRSAVGKSIGRLEKRLEVRLFHRTTRSMTLSEDGQFFYEHCLRALAELRAGRETLASGKSVATGRLRASLPVLFGRRCVAPILTSLAGKHPLLELELNFSDRTVDLVEDGYDLAIRSGAPEGGAGLMTRRLASQTMILCAAPRYLAENGTPRSIGDLARHALIAYAARGQLRTWLFPRRGHALIEIQPAGRMRFDDLESISDAVADGHGIGWLPRWLVSDRLGAGEIVEVLADVPPLVVDIHAVWPETPHLPFRTRLAIDALVQELPRTMDAI